MRSHYYDEIVGETIIYNGKPAIFEDMNLIMKVIFGL